MDADSLRAWRSHRQGLDGRWQGDPPEAVLERTGWARSVGGANPYLALFARSGTGRAFTDQAVAEQRILELPSARSCTYVLPRAHFALGLSVGGQGGAAETAAAVRSLGVTMAELCELEESVCRALKGGPLDPRAIKDCVGSAARSLGQPGKKAGLSSTLPLVLGRLQARGAVRRVHYNGRLDTQRYAYALWAESPAQEEPDRDRAFQELARQYFLWTGPARLTEFQRFSGLGVRAARQAVTGLDLVETEGHPELLLLAEDVAQFRAFERPKRELVSLVGSLDNLFHLRIGLKEAVDPADAECFAPTHDGFFAVGGLSELTSHAIVDRGRLIGVWEFDPDEGRIAWATWRPASEAVREAVAKTEAFVKEELGDARSFSLDSPKSRRPRLDTIQRLAL